MIESGHLTQETLWEAAAVPLEGDDYAHLQLCPDCRLELEARESVLRAEYTTKDDEEASAYEQLLLDVLEGDHTPFLRFDEVEWSWRIVQPVLDAWKTGMPEDYVAKGDPYSSHCAETTALLRKKLKFNDERLVMTFQSRFGTAEWLKPYTDATVKSLAERGVKNLAVITPGFSADCLETLEEIAMENAEIFRKAGGENFAAIPCLNDSQGGMAVIRDIVVRELKGWI